MDENLIAYQDYLIKEKNYSKLTLKAYVSDVESFGVFLFDFHEGVQFVDVGYSLIRSWIVSLVESGVSNKTVNRKVSSLKSFYLFLLKIKVITVNPLLKHKSLKVSKKVQVSFSEKEIKDVFELNDFSDDFDGVRDQLVIELFYATGIRRAELINLKLRNVDFSNKIIKVLGKRNKERILPLLKCTEVLLLKYIELRRMKVSEGFEDLLILSKKGNKIGESFVYRLINDYFSAVSLKVKKSPHVLRHSFATHLLNNGADLNSVKELLGHASLSSTQIYTHSSLSELKKVYKDAHPRS
ncbi:MULTISPECIES: tyrosine-type recombinase/integrase [Flavobacterium]|uniref:Tyrosine recombinase XerC n=1 Tax=Flavobacterium jumunjinense TaxID=998845 RepID=A0ABV5GR95_9FLAO|nr:MULTISPECIES: tyrosine-type recombinase/integrase [Flavobacterium]